MEWMEAHISEEGGLKVLDVTEEELLVMGNEFRPEGTDSSHVGGEYIVGETAQDLQGAVQKRRYIGVVWVCGR